MNNLLLTKERIKRAERLRLAQLAATKNGMLITYKHSVFEERKKHTRGEVSAMDS